MRRLLIYCDGGFGNRYNALVSGLAMAHTLGLAPQVIWPANNWCGARLSELFETHGLLHGVPVVERELATYAAERASLHHVMVEDRLGIAPRWGNPLHHADWSAVRTELASSTRDVFFYTALVPPFVDAACLMQQVQGLHLRQAIVDRARHFLAQHGLGTQLGDYLGVQIRRTDFGDRGADVDALFDMVSRCSDRRFFVCSDDATVEARFAALPQVAVYPKRAHVEKRVAGDWNAVNTDHSGRLYPFNVERSAASVEDALVDLLLLSRSQLVMTSQSTFLRTALLLQRAGCSPQPGMAKLPAEATLAH